MENPIKVLILDTDGKSHDLPHESGAAGIVSRTYVNNVSDFIAATSSGSYDILRLDGIDSLSGTLKSVRKLNSPKRPDSFPSADRVIPRRKNMICSEGSGFGKLREIKLTRQSESPPVLNRNELRIVSQTAATLSHEINNPLMTISANAEMVLSKESDLGHDVKEKVRIIASMADRIRKVTHCLMDLEHLEYRNTANGPMINLNPGNNNNSSVPIDRVQSRVKNISLDKKSGDHILVKRL